MEIHAHRDTRTYVYITALVCGRLPGRSEMQIQLGNRATSGNLSTKQHRSEISNLDTAQKKKKNVNSTAILKRSREIFIACAENV